MVFSRSAVIDMEFMIASIFLVVSPGIRPSHGIGVMTQSNFASSQIALTISTSQPVQLPEASAE